jgi:hypothetical protein
MHTVHWLQAHWIALTGLSIWALTGLSILVWVAGRFMETLTTLASRSDQSEPDLMGLIDSSSAIHPRHRLQQAHQ